jgi:alkylated DNA repair dioxygenase AlkB
MEAPPATPSTNTGTKITLDNEGSVLYYYPTFLPSAEAQHYLQTLLASIPWKNQDDSWEQQPRKVAWFSDKGETLTYSKVHLPSNPWLAPLLELKEKILKLPEVASYHTHTKIDSCLANLYENGDNFLGFHSDTPKMWGPRPLIASLTLGSARKFILVRKSAAKEHRGAAILVTDPADRHEFGKRGSKAGKGKGVLF